MSNDLVVDCHVCGVRDILRWNKYTNKVLVFTKTCFICNFWMEKIFWEEDVLGERAKCVRVGGTHYTIGAEESSMRGHGGRRFYILFNDGKKVISTNVWYQGEIPPHFTDMLPDNAVFCNVLWEKIS